MEPIIYSKNKSFCYSAGNTDISSLASTDFNTEHKYIQTQKCVATKKHDYEFLTAFHYESILKVAPSSESLCLLFFNPPFSLHQTCMIFDNHVYTMELLCSIRFVELDRSDQRAELHQTSVHEDNIPKLLGCHLLFGLPVSLTDETMREEKLDLWIVIDLMVRHGYSGEPGHLLADSKPNSESEPPDFCVLIFSSYHLPLLLAIVQLKSQHGLCQTNSLLCL